VRLNEYVDVPTDGPPVIKDRTFRNVVLQGPLVVVPSGSSLISVTFGIEGTDPEAMLFLVEEGDEKIGAVVLQNCVIENCVTEHIAFAGTREWWDGLLGQVGGP
jgi:hypothetical protein